jgi:hypothetical protein
MIAARLLLLALLATAGPARAAERMQFWNLTSSTLTGVWLAPAGTTAFGPNQCVNDRDGAVDHDERLRLTGIEPGTYDVRITTKRGRRCVARNVAVRGDGRYAFSLSDEDLKECETAAAQ